MYNLKNLISLHDQYLLKYFWLRVRKKFPVSSLVNLKYTSHIYIHTRAHTPASAVGMVGPRMPFIGDKKVEVVFSCAEGRREDVK